MWTRTLMLTPWYFPHKIVGWQDAVTMIYLKKVDVIVSYEETLRSPSVSLKAPAVIRLKRGLSHRQRGVKFSRINVYLRDGFRCQYCNSRDEMNRLTYDHVLPRAQGGRTTWTNIVTACYDCNALKGNRTPAQAKMPLLKVPIRPKSLPHHPLALEVRRVPPEWQDFFDTPTVSLA